MSTPKHTCRRCGTTMSRKDESWWCSKCDTEERTIDDLFKDDDSDPDYVFIECPGATLYEPGTNNVVAGVRYIDNDDPSRGYEIIDEPVFAPNHKKKRRIRRDAVGKIRRCRACQDYTVRMRRREGPDFFIPSNKYPGRTKLKSVRHISYEP